MTQPELEKPQSKAERLKPLFGVVIVLAVLGAVAVLVIKLELRGP